MLDKLIQINPAQPEDVCLQQAVKIIQAGGVIALPTDTSYGLAVNPYDNQAVDKVYQLKGRDFKKPLLLLISDERQLEELTQELAPDVWDLVKQFWPGSLTLIFNASPRLSKYKIAGSGKIGVRLPDSIVARAIVDAVKTPITATSANLSGQTSSYSVEQVSGYFGEKLDLIIDGGPSKQKIESTVLDVSIFPAKLIRSGAVPVEQLSTVIPLA